MSQVAKLKKQAADFEAKKQFDKAVGVYIKLLEGFDSYPTELDVGLFNRVGDLLLRQGNVADAVDYYEQGIDRYVETGFFNNAIALCNKVLRHSPGRASIYYKLGRISAKKGFTNEARTNFLEYADRMQKSGKVDEAFRALTEFADLCPDQDEIRLTLAEQLLRAGRKDDALEQLQTLHERLDGEGRADDARSVVQRMRAIDPAVEPRKSRAARQSKNTELVFIDLDEPITPSIPQGIPLVPPSVPSELVELPPPVATPAVGTKAVTPPDGSLMLSSAVDPEYAIEEAPPEPLLGFEPTEVDSNTGRPSNPAGIIFEAVSTFGLPTAPKHVPVGEPAIESAREPVEETPPTPEAAMESLPAAEAEEWLEQDLRAEVEASVDTETPPEPLDAPMEELLGDVARPKTPAPEQMASPVRSAPSFPSPVLSPTLSVPATPLVEPEPDMPEVSLSAADTLGDSTDYIRETTPVHGLLEPEFDVPTAADSAVDEMVVEPPEFTPSGANPSVDTPEPPRTPKPSLPSGIMLADALEASSRPADVAEAPATIDERLDADPIAFPTPSQTRRSTAVAAESVEALMADVQAAPENWGLHRDLGEAMLDAGDRVGGIRELEYAMAGAERDGKLDLASAIAEEVARIEPDSVKHQQKRVEYAFRTNDRVRLIEAYLGLANVLLRADQVEKARTIYQRVIDLAPDEPRARLALGSITPTRGPVTRGFTPIAPRSVRSNRDVVPSPRRSGPAPVRPPSGSYINLGDMLRGDDVPRDTRMVVPEEEPTGDEQADFADMLRKFKAGIARNVAPEDHQSHYDLAIAYKEMGLVDEAIAEFQKALGGPTNRLPTYEALGQCFLEKEQYKLASSILSRALGENASDDQLVGILYLLGRSAEMQGKAEDALNFYQRVFVVDIQFRDIVDRMSEVEQTLR